MKTDIRNREDIKILVNAFYDKVNRDPLLAPVFSHVDWPKHLPVMYDFWASALFGEQSYRGNPFQKHLGLPLQTIHFDHWLVLFTETIAENFAGAKADEANERARTIAAVFQHKLGLLN